jgi:hypothetical protein
MLRAMQGKHWLVATVAVAALGCGGATKKGPDGVGNGTGDSLLAAPPAGPVKLADVEARLLGARAIAVDFHIRADGAHAGEVKGDLRMTLDNHVRWRFSGTFDGQPVSIDTILDASAGAHLSEAVVLGFTRMGLLHNIAQLATGHGVDHAADGIGDWVLAKERDPADDAVTLDISVSGMSMADARLEVDALGLPRERAQTVRSPNGEMHVEEHYSTSTPDAIESSVFVEQ